MDNCFSSSKSLGSWDGIYSFFKKWKKEGKDWFPRWFFSKTVILSGLVGVFYNDWRHFWLLQLGRGKGYYWHLLGRGQGTAKCPTVNRTSTPNKESSVLKCQCCRGWEAVLLTGCLENALVVNLDRSVEPARAYTYTYTPGLGPWQNSVSCVEKPIGVELAFIYGVVWL